MTEQTIILALSASIDQRKFPFKLHTSFIYDWESDFWAMSQDGETREFEIKVSRADYLKDAKKEKHQKCDATGANFFYYVCPEGLIKKQEVDKRYGLIYVQDSNHLYLEKKPQRLNNNRFEQWQMLANKMYWKWFRLWQDKYISHEITTQQYDAGFSEQLQLIDNG